MTEPLEDFIADFRAGDRTYADHDEVVALLATIDSERAAHRRAEERAENAEGDANQWHQRYAVAARDLAECEELVNTLRMSENK